MEEIIDLQEYWRVIRKRLLVVIALPLIAAVTSAVFSFFILHPVYEASAMVIVGRQAANKDNPGLDYSSVMANQQMAKTYETIAKSQTVLERVANQVGGGATPGSLSDAITVKAVTNTEIISINVQDPNPDRAALIANTLTKEFSARIMEIKKVDNVGLVDAATAPQVPIKPNKKLNIAMAFALGLFAAMGLVFLLEYLDNSIKTAEEIEELTGLTVLGIIPQFSALNNPAK